LFADGLASDKFRFMESISSSRLPISLPAFIPGTVWIVGAGPGDPGLLTLAGWHGLQNADVIVYDALVGDDVLKLAGADAELEYAGKRGGKPSPEQSDISDRLVGLAKEGRKVLRLKGGDPFVFGRGAEECLALAAAGITFRIVPGITAGVGGLAYAGIPMTTRGANTAVTFITGHAAGGSVPDDVNWEALAGGSPVLLFYMGATTLDIIADKLIGAGRSPDEPVALISKATLPEQIVVQSRLSDCYQDLKSAKLAAPTLIVVGEIVALRDQLNWW
jgi:uroporphyrin-III C-methyltransferase